LGDIDKKCEAAEAAAHNAAIGNSTVEKGEVVE
jgi:hypothetical protein